jgi:hypothetical protein
MYPQNGYGCCNTCTRKLRSRSTTRSRLAVIHRTGSFMSIVGLLNYLAKQTRFDVATITSILSQFLQHADQSMMDIAFRVLVYFRDRAYEGIITCSRDCTHPSRKRGTPNILYAYADASHAHFGLEPATLLGAIARFLRASLPLHTIPVRSQSSVITTSWG